MRRFNVLRRVQFAVLTLAVTLALLWVGTVTWLVRNDSEQSREALLHSTQLLVRAVNAKLEQFASVGRVIASSPSIDDLAMLELEARRAIKVIPDAWILLADADGKMVFNTRLPAGTPGPGRSDLAMTTQRKACRTGREELSDLGIGPVAALPVVTINFPIVRSGSPCRVIAVVFLASTLKTFMEEVPDHYLAGVIDSRGNYVVRSQDNDALVGQAASEGWQRIQQKTGVFEFPSRSGEAYVTANVSLPTGWAGAISISSRSFYRPMWLTAGVAGLVGIIAIGLSLALAMNIGRRITAALDQLKQAIVGLRRGKPFIKNSGIGQIDEVIDEFNQTTKELERHERAADLINSELNHRSKNLLSVILGISSMTARQSSDLRDFKQKFEQRLIALSRCQDILINHQWDQVPLAEIVQCQVSPIAGDRLDIQGGSVSIPFEKVQALCMVFHELATNASKYGALSVPTGRVMVAWSRSEHDNETLVIWTEIGGPEVRMPSRVGFGTTVIVESCEVASGKRPEIDYKADGLTCAFWIVDTVGSEDPSEQLTERKEARFLPAIELKTVHST